MKIQLNADVGEGMNNDVALMPFLTYANIACGGHMGDIDTITKAIKLAERCNVKVGAHPSYPDKVNFGRQSMSINRTDLEKVIEKQIDLFLQGANISQVPMHHIKLHGALYNDVFMEEKSTCWFLNFIFKKYKDVKLFVPIGAKDFVDKDYQSIVLFEAFADRNYNDQLQLVARSESRASIENPSLALKHVQQLFLENKLTSVAGNKHKIQADTFCLHGDNRNVLAIAEEIYQLKKSV